MDEVTADGPAGGEDGLKPGDQILELGGDNFRKLTLEQALLEMQRKGDEQLSALVQYNEHSGSFLFVEQNLQIYGSE